MSNVYKSKRGIITMGMSASQARLLSITARQSDVEFKSQMISNAKMRLASESEQVSTNYLDALSKTKLQAKEWDNEGNYSSVDMNYNYFNSHPEGIRLMMSPTAIGKQVVLENISDWTNENIESKALKYKLTMPTEITDIRQIQAALINQATAEKRYFPSISASQIALMLASGEYLLQTKLESDDDTKWKDTSISGSSKYAEVSDPSEIAKTEAEYNAATLKLNNKEKKLDLQLKQLDTEHSALQTEYESVKGVISKNIETSFKTFA